MTAFGGTAGVFFVMASLSSVIKRDLSGMGKWLFVGALASWSVASSTCLSARPPA
jgi:modulator of FtsH protease